MVNCCAFRCPNRSEKNEEGVTFHRFPVDAERRVQWVSNMRMANWTPSKNNRLCSVHFEERYFRRTASTTRLLAQAVPTRFLNFPSHLQSRASSKRFRTSRGRSEFVFTQEPQHGPSDLSDTPHEAKYQRQLFRSKLTSKKKSNKIKGPHQSSKCYKKKFISLKQMVCTLETQNLISPENSILLNNLSDFNKELLKRKQQFKSNYEPIRKFAMTLNYLSPKAYEYVRRMFNTCLPHSSTIGKLFQNVNANPGFTTEAFEAVKRKVDLSPHKLMCALVIDEMTISRHLEWDGQKYHGYVNFGVDLNDDGNALAKEAFVFLIVCINGMWKVPCGYFFTAELGAIQKKDLVCKCISLLKQTGVQLVSLTFDGIQSNISMSNMLGCEISLPNLKTVFTYKNCNVHVFYNSCHMLKLIRNAFAHRQVLIDGDGLSIEWNFLLLLDKLQRNVCLQLRSKLRAAHIKFFNQKIKDRLAVHLLSSSVADALEFCDQVLHLMEFRNCKGTVRFIRMMNNIFEILNSRTLVAPKFKKALTKSNITETKIFIQEAIKYISTLKFGSGELVVNSKCKTGFVGFIVDLTSAQLLFDEMVEKNNCLTYLPLYKISQDHIELFFSSMRSRGGWNNNPTARQFAWAYKHLLIRSESRDTSVGNCILLEQIPILVCTSTNQKTDRPEEVINNSLFHKTTFDQDIENQLENIFAGHEYIMNSTVLTEFSLQIVIYIAGFVVKHLLQILKCEDCVLSLTGKKENFLHYLITQKSRGGLIYPSDDVIAICKKTEECLRIQHYQGSLQKHNILQVVTNEVLMYFMDRNIFQCLESHVLNNESNHIYFLIKSVAQKYINVRIHFISKRESEKSEHVQNFYTKMFLFRGQ